jgi:WW domain-containing oxidoreductase
MNSIPRKSGFDRRATAMQVTEGIDLRGRTFVVTGANSGLGLETLRVLSLRGAHVVALARNLEKAEQACAQLRGKSTAIACELSDLESVVDCARAIKALPQPIDALVCNAGIMALPKLEQKMGLELQFLTNHLGHFVLVNHLLDKIIQAPAGRIVMLSSAAHLRTPEGGIDFDNLSGEKGYSGWRFYGQSKLANLLTAKELARRLDGTRATANAVHPGVINTNLGRHMPGVLRHGMRLVAGLAFKTVEQGAATQCYVATHPELAGVSGEYFADSNIKKPRRCAENGELAGRLWKTSEQLAAGYL